MSSYMRTPEMMSGGPFICQNGNSFYCYNCGKKLSQKIIGPCNILVIKCPRCHSSMLIRMKKLNGEDGKPCSSKMSVEVKDPMHLHCLCKSCGSFISIKMGEPAPFAERFVEARKNGNIQTGTSAG